MCTIVPEQERFWHQNLAKSVLKLPSAVAFLPKHSILAIADKSSSTVFLANLHDPVCLIRIAGPKDSISSPVGIVFKDCLIIVLNSGTSSSIKIIDISYVLKKSRALLQVDLDDEREAGLDEEHIGGTAKVKTHNVHLWSTTGDLQLGRLTSLTTKASSQSEEIAVDTTVFVLSYNESMFKISNFIYNC